MTSLENRKSDNSMIASYSFPILDGVGNRMQAEISEPLGPVAAPEQTGYTYNDKKNRLETAGTDTFTHDNEGQLSTISTTGIVSLTNYTFDHEHRLVNTDGNQYSYDGKGNRLKAVRNGEMTYFIHDISSNVPAEADGNKSITKLYIHGQGLLAMVTATDQVYSYHYNAIGSTTAITDQGQNVVNAYSYNSFGKIMNQIETVPQLFKYVGLYGVMAEPNGFYYMRARYYDPKTGRFISEDPIGFAGGTVNLYEYVQNNPVNFVDPLGLETYQCTKPLTALTEKFGSEASEWAHKNLHYAYHQYSCVVLSDGALQCGGQDHEGSPLYGPGKKSNDQFRPESCKKTQPDNDCFERCMIDEWSKPRPKYGIPFGKDCQNYDNDVNKRCLKQCIGKK